MISFPSSLSLADFPCGRGVAVTRAVQRGEVLLTVPLSQCWTAASARRRLEVPVAMTEKEAIIAELMVLKLKDGVGWMLFLLRVLGEFFFSLRLMDLVDGEFGCWKESKKCTCWNFSRCSCGLPVEICWWFTMFYPWNFVCKKDLLIFEESEEKSSHVALLPSLESMNLPPFWKESDLAELEGSEVHTHSVRLQEELQEDFETLQQKLLGCEIKASFKTFQWAWSIYSSRVMSLTTDTGSIFAIVPGLDMFNHSPTVSPGLFQMCDDVVQVKAGEDLTTGQQAYINYAADMYNSQMLLSFGFILDDPNLQSSEITLSLQVSQAQLEVHRLVLDALEGPLFQILHLPSDASNSELILKHILTFKDPLPPAFLSMVRIQHLQDLPSKSAMELALNGLQSKDELRALFLISMLLEGKLQGLQRSEHDHPTSRQELAWKQCSGERLVLQAALDEAKKMQMKSIQKALMKVTSTDGHCDDEDCEKAQTPWLHRLRRASKQLTADVSSVARLSKNLCDRLPVAHLIQSCHILNLWLVVRHDHKLLQRLCFASETWPFVVSGCNIETLALPNCGSGGGGYPNSSTDGSSKDKNSYLSLYHEKMKLWGSWLTAQWIHAEAIQMDELSSMGHEQAGKEVKIWGVNLVEFGQIFFSIYLNVCDVCNSLYLHPDLG